MLAAHMSIKKSPQPKAIFYFIYFLFHMFPISHASYFVCLVFFTYLTSYIRRISLLSAILPRWCLISDRS